MLLLAVLIALASADAFDPQRYCFANPNMTDDSSPGDGLQLVRIQLLTRHGDRTPVSVMPVASQETVEWNCTLNFLVAQTTPDASSQPQRFYRKSYLPGREVLPGNCYYGQLTSRGAQQHQQFGAQFRKLYVDQYGFLASELNTSDVWLRSTDVERTILSSYNFMAGLYPAAAPQTLTLHTMDSARDDAFGTNDRLCPAVGPLTAAIKASAAVQSFYAAKLAPLAAKYGAVWNTTLSMGQVQDVNDVLRSRFCHDQPLPTGMTQEDANAWMEGVNALDTMVNSNGTLLAISQYPFLSEWLTAFKTADGPRFRYYSAHDSTIRSFMLALHAFDGSWPPLASHVVLEHWRDASGNDFIAMQYNGKRTQMQPPCHAEMCSLADFEQLVESYKVDPSACNVE